MISWESSTFIARPAEEVFAYVADVRNDPNWHKDVQSATVIKGNGQLGEGTVFDVKAKVSGTEEIIAYEAPHKVVLKGGDMGRWFRPTSARSSRSTAGCGSPGTWTSTQAASWVG
jgi:uncharacterized protein YndB with AHSA1/START domain